VEGNKPIIIHLVQEASGNTPKKIGLDDLCLTDKIVVLSLCGLYLYFFARPWFEQRAREEAMEAAENVVAFKKE
jgi:hypothetical protein